MSDDSNPLFLYLATIDVQRFLKLRREQNLFVEFSHFSDKVSALLDFCTAAKEDDQGENRFICMMNQLDDGSIIDIFEHNEFRNLLHLRLDFKKATPEETSEWLAKKVLM